MKKIFVDLEMNRVEKEYPDIRKICSHEIIQVGAVKLNEQNKEIDSFCKFVFPVYSSKMNKHIEELTGIRFEQLAEAEKIESVLKEFIAWCGEDCEVYSWSLTDKTQLEKEVFLKDIELDESEKSMFERWHDYQAEFGDYFHFDNPMGLKTALDLAGMDFSGAAHNGLDDARNTAGLYMMTQDADLFRAFEEKVLEYCKPKECSAALGDLFDFSSILCA